MMSPIVHSKRWREALEERGVWMHENYHRVRAFYRREDQSAGTLLSFLEARTRFVETILDGYLYLLEGGGAVITQAKRRGDPPRMGMSLLDDVEAACIWYREARRQQGDYEARWRLMLDATERFYNLLERLVEAVEDLEGDQAARQEAAYAGR